MIGAYSYTITNLLDVPQRVQGVGYACSGYGGGRATIQAPGLEKFTVPLRREADGGLVTDDLGLVVLPGESVTITLELYGSDAS